MFILINLYLISCTNSKFSQCQEIINFVNQVANETKALTINQSEKNYQPWLQAADKMEDASQQMQDLPIRDTQLKNYKTGFIQMYANYSQATREIIKARQNKSLDQAKIAQKKAKEAADFEKKLSNNINKYCLQQ